MDPPEGSRLEKMKTRKSHSSYIGASGRNGKRTNGILYNYRVRFFLLSQVLSSLADLSLRDRRCSLPYCGCALLLSLGFSSFPSVLGDTPSVLLEQMGLVPFFAQLFLIHTRLQICRKNKLGNNWGLCGPLPFHLRKRSS